MIQDSILNLVQSKEMTDQHQMPISFNLGKLPLLVQLSTQKELLQSLLNPLKKRRLLYIKTQSVKRSNHFSSGL